MKTAFRRFACLGVIVLLSAWGVPTITASPAAAPDSASAVVTIVRPRVEGRDNPLGLDTEQPRFSWQLASRRRGVIQTAYHILVASHPDTLAADRGDLWDSGEVASAEQLWIAYGGTALRPNQECHWKVRAVTTVGTTPWSSPARWSTGMMGESHWHGRWIGYERAFAWDDETTHSRLSARYLRREFSVAKPIVRATLHIAGLGLYEAFVNGRRVGTQVLAPAPTDYRRSIIYDTHDVTALVAEGDNCIGVTLAPGRYYTMRQHYKPHKITNFGYPKLRAELIIEFADGKRQVLATDTSWRLTAEGPICRANEYDGETYDARREAAMAGWATAGYEDSTWLWAERAAIPDGTLVGNVTPGMEVMGQIRPASLDGTLSGTGAAAPSARVKPQSLATVGEGTGTTIIDFGENFAGRMRLNVAGKGQRGDTICLRFAERLDSAGGLYTANLRDAEATDYYICSGTDTGTWTPRFVTHGFRYVEVTNYPAAVADDFVGEVISDPMASIGRFHCADSTLNAIVAAARRGVVSNYKGMPVDCPQRNERMPWLGDRTGGCRGESFLLDNATLYAKWMDDIAQSQRSDGVIPDVAPAYWNYYTDNVSWPAVFILGAEMLYDQYGDLRPVEKHYEAMKRWVTHFEKEKKDRRGLITADRYGDWCPPPESPTLIHSQDPSRQTDGALIATAYLYRLAATMARFDTLLMTRVTPLRADELRADIEHWHTLRTQLREAFNREFLHVKAGTSPAPSHLLYPDSIYYGNNSLTSNLLPLAFDIVPPEHRRDVERQVLAKLLRKPADGHLCCGVIGIQWLMKGLSRMGRADVAWLLATTRSYPSWGYMIDHGATTLWELWNGDTASPKMNSGNHVMLLGDVVTWCFENVGGIQAAAPAYRRLRLAPDFDIPDLSHAEVDYDSPYGLVRSHWQKDYHHLEWDVEIPAGATATVCLPPTAVMDSLIVTSDGEAVTTASLPRPDEAADTQLTVRFGTADGKSSRRRHAFTSTRRMATPAPAVTRAAAAPTEIALSSGRYHISVALNPAAAAGRESILREEFLYEQAPFPSCHAATLAELPNGDLLCAFFGGTREAHPDVCIWTCRKRRLPDGSMEPVWSDPVMVQDGVLNDTLRKACYNPVLYQVPGGELLLFFKIGRNVRDWTGYIIRSGDNGYSWSERERLRPAEGYDRVTDASRTAEPLIDDSDGARRTAAPYPAMLNEASRTAATYPATLNGASRDADSIVHTVRTDCRAVVPPDSLLGAIKNKPEWIGGRIVAPSSKEAGGWRCYVEISDDAGATWRLVGPVAQSRDMRTIQPALLRHADGRIQMLCRTRSGRVGTSWSADGGESWSPMTLLADLPNNNSGLDAVTLADGTHVVVYNDFSIVDGPDKPMRNPLCVATSRDGLHWQKVATLEDSPISQYSYPCVIAGRDGTLHVAYTWRRQRIKYIQLKL